MSKKELFNELVHKINRIKKYKCECLLGDIINPLSPYFLCDHLISFEVNELNIYTPHNKNNILVSLDISTIKDYDIIQCQFNCFNYFFDEIFPKIDKKIILFTSEWSHSIIEKNEKTDNLLNDKRLVLWISHKPIYPDQKKYIGFPNGICPSTLEKYSDEIIKYNRNLIKVDEANKEESFCDLFFMQDKDLLTLEYYKKKIYKLLYDITGNNKFIEPIKIMCDCYICEHINYKPVRLKKYLSVIKCDYDWTDIIY
jgi:hypothetical protein